jgi:RHS repeat-associated protein
VEEITGGSVSRQYTYGHDLISQNQLISGNWQVSFYGYDGHGSVRFLTDAAGTVTDTYDYDAFGNLVNQTGNTPNTYLYAGEQWDSDLGLYYNRARYLNVGAGRFWTQDDFEGIRFDPITLHKYLYASGDPINKNDPTGNLSGNLADFSVSTQIATVLITAVVLSFAIIAGVFGGSDEDDDKKGSSYVYRGDDNYRLGRPIGYPLDSQEAANADIQAPWDHVRRDRTSQTSRFLSFSYSKKSAEFFGSRVYKVKYKQLLVLEAEGEIRILTRDQIVQTMLNSGDRDLIKDAPNVNQIMLKHQELLIEGQIPGGVLKPAK